MDDFDDSLPSHSVFVPTSKEGGEKPKPKPKPFLRKGSRREPSAANRNKSSTSFTSDETNGEEEEHGSFSKREIPLSHSGTGTGTGNGNRDAVSSNDQFETRHVVNSRAVSSSVWTAQHKLQQFESRERFEETNRDELDTSMVSTSSLCFGDTSTIDLHERLANERQQARIETIEFEKIEQELENIAVTPLLMSSREKIHNDTFSSQKISRNSDNASVDSGGSRESIYEHDFENENGDKLENNWVDQPAEYFVSSKPSDEPLRARYNEEDSGLSDRGFNEQDDVDRYSIHDKTTDQTLDPDMYDDNEYIGGKLDSSNALNQPSFTRGVMDDINLDVDDSQSWQNEEETRRSGERSSYSEHRYNSQEASFSRNGAIGDSRTFSSGLRQSSKATMRTQTNLSSSTGTGLSRTSARSSGSKSSHQSKAIRPLSANSRKSQSKTIATPAKKADSDDIGPRLAEKAKELENEIETYKKENSNLKHVRKQQELILADLEKQRSELKSWIESEKEQTLAYCKETKEAANKERRSAAKYARDTRAAAEAGNTGPNRKERAEIEALHATIQKLKVEHGEEQKKWKSNAARLHQSSKDKDDLISRMKSQLASLEAELARLNGTDAKKKKKPKKMLAGLSSYAEEEMVSGETDIMFDQQSTTTSRSVVSSTVSDPFLASRRRHTSSSGIVEYETLGEDYELADTVIEEVVPSETHITNYNSSSGGISGNLMEYTDNSNRLESSGHSENMEVRRSRSRLSRESRAADQVYDPSRYDSNSRKSRETLQDHPEASNLYESTGHKQDHQPSSPGADHRTNVSSPKRVVEVGPDGVRVTKYSNGTIKKVLPDGQQEVFFLNGDTKLTHTSGTVVYYYANAQTTHTTHADGTEVYEFPNNQVEKHFPDGKKEILFPNKTKKTIYPNLYEVFNYIPLVIFWLKWFHRRAYFPTEWLCENILRAERK